MRDVKFGLFLVPPDVDSAQDTARHAERDGFYSVSHADHFYSPAGTPESPQLECYTVLAAIAAVTQTIRIVPAVGVVGFRPPALLAKIATTLDLASNGRFICGLGAGWYGVEYEAHGYPFPPVAERLAQLEECVGILKAMWTEEVPSFTGKHFSVDRAYNNPRPVQDPHPPIMLGGSGTGLLKIAARHADIINIIPPISNGRDFFNHPDVAQAFDMTKMKQRIAVLHGLMRDEGRDPADIELSGLVVLGLAANASDSAPRELAANLGFPDYETAQRSPVVLLGTADEVKREVEKRLRDTKLTYYLGIPYTEASYELMARDVIPAFS